ncbi:MAG TPA: peptidyl-prolyl cis-trans isomerase [Solirubrobacterales bacterium]|nr:peptidyl-prolyl cis-trans isomerase [Solirubrobacterales bacterium]
MQRLALLGFGALLLVLFLGFAIAQGLGNPDVPSDAVAVVEDTPDDVGTITRDELARAIEQAAAAAQVVPVPKPGDDKYDELQKKALEELLDAVWIQGQAEEMGISVTEQEVAKELDKLKSQSFKTEKQYEEFLKEAKYTQADVDKRVKLQLVGTQLQEQVTNDAPTPSTSEIEDYYEAAKSSQYTTPESRDIRLVKNTDKAKVEEAKAALEKDDSVKSWEKVAQKYSNDTTKGAGGLRAGVNEGTLPEPLNAAVFSAGQGEIEGPFQEGPTFTVFEVMKVTPEKVRSLDEVKSQISSQLSEQLQQQSFAGFVRNYSSTWKSRTFCDSEVLIERCANFRGNGQSAEAEPACYEAEPKTPAKACPAPITQVKPAQPGSVSLLAPEGQKLAQRPRPAGEEAPAGASPESLGVPPPTGAPSE